MTSLREAVAYAQGLFDSLDEEVGTEMLAAEEWPKEAERIFNEVGNGFHLRLYTHPEKDGLIIELEDRSAVGYYFFWLDPSDDPTWYQLNLNGDLHLYAYQHELVKEG